MEMGENVRNSFFAEILYLQVKHTTYAGQCFLPGTSTLYSLAIIVIILNNNIHLTKFLIGHFSNSFF